MDIYWTLFWPRQHGSCVHVASFSKMEAYISVLHAGGSHQNILVQLEKI